MIRTFLLPPADIERVREAGGPLAQFQDLSTIAQTMTIAVVEVDGRIVAYWVLWKALHLEPLYVAEDHRKSPAVIRGIIRETIDAAQALGEPSAFATIEEAELDLVSTYAARLGFEPAPGKLFYVTIPAREPVGV